MPPFSISTQVSFAIFGPLAVGAVFTFLSMWLAGRNAKHSAKSQNDLTSKLKLADFRQAWINQLRDAFAELQGRALTSSFTDDELREIYRLATKVRLLMNRSDERYDELSALIDMLIANANQDGRHKLARDLTPIAQ